MPYSEDGTYTPLDRKEVKRRVRNAKQRGRGWENEIAKKLGGVRHILSKGGDVETPNLVIECKYRKDADGLKLLKQWIDKAKIDADKLNKLWLLALNFGDNSGGYILMPVSMFQELTEEKAVNEVKIKEENNG